MSWQAGIIGLLLMQNEMAFCGTISFFDSVGWLGCGGGGRSGKHGKLTVRTDDEENDVQTGVSPGTFSVLDLTYNSKFYVGGVVDQAVDAVCTLSLFLPSLLHQTKLFIVH